MHYTVAKLISGDAHILSYYDAACSQWQAILAKPEASSSETLSGLLTIEQHNFEHLCGGRQIGQEIMVLVGIAQFYTATDGFGRNRARAKLVYDAIQASYCSVEVKGYADIVAKSYDLINQPEQ